MSLRDRRNSSDVFSMPGDFTTVDQSGSVQPLKTYGILQVKVQDENNQKLDLAGNMKIYLDADKVEHRYDEYSRNTISLRRFNSLNSLAYTP